MSSWSDGGTRSRSWLRHCSPSQKVAGSVFDGIICNFYWHNPSGRTMAPGPIQLLTEMNTRNIAWEVKVVGAYDWQHFEQHVPIVLRSGSLSLLNPLRACPGLCRDYFVFFLLRKDPQLSTLSALLLSLFLPLLRSFHLLRFHFVLCCFHQNISHNHLPLPTAENLKMRGGFRSHKVSTKFHSSGF